jgi:hypothetical protein
MRVRNRDNHLSSGYEATPASLIIDSQQLTRRTLLQNGRLPVVHKVTRHRRTAAHRRRRLGRPQAVRVVGRRE